ncbi:unnamed protein product [Protopolystoma xenopodis]|uniref:EF-hand domain-containing protein n=1 Tax=Protopolystoma xenopodis TaxID=117903 RepID=A0A448X499_9PLAT|nr:unnamed protein product [Protopolystoma xenopodis]
MENRKEPQSLSFFFRLLDVGGQRKLTAMTLAHFYTGVEARLKSADHDPPCLDDVLNEIFDMIKPKNPQYITLDDLINW